MQNRVPETGRRAYTILRKWWSDYQHPKAAFRPGLDLTRRVQTNTAAIEKARSHGNLQAFLTTRLTGGVHTVWHRGLPVDLSLSVKPGAPLTVVFHGAADPKVRLPWLSGFGITKSIETSRLSISDPSLYLDSALNLAWFSGSHVQPDLINVLHRIINKVTESVKAPRIILFGGSGGGYASLRMLEHFRGATAIVMNPQTDIEKYHKTHVQRYVDLAWEGNRDHLHSAARTTVFNSVEKAQGTARVLYLQNGNDNYHVVHHLNPFRECFGGTPGFTLLQEPWQDGHTPPPKETIQQILSTVIGGHWGDLTSRHGFTQL